MTESNALTDDVKKLARQYGASLVGIASLDRFRNAPLMLSPKGLLPSARSVVVIATYFLDASMELMEQQYRLHQYDIYGNNQYGTGMNRRMEHISYWVSRFLENKGFGTLPIASSNIWRYRSVKGIDHPFAPDIAHRYAAVAAGLGEIGWNGCLMTPQYGPRVRLNTIITEAPLEADPQYTGPALCDRCMQCVHKCPTQMFSKEVSKINRLQIGEKLCEFPDTNKWRCMYASFNMLADIPEKNNADVFYQMLETYGNRGPDQGVCTYVCLPPDLRQKDEQYSNTWRRKREADSITPDEATTKAQSIIEDNRLEYLAVLPVDTFEKRNIPIRKHMPDAKSVIVFGHHASDVITKWGVANRLMQTAFDLTHTFQDLGYSSLAKTLIPESLLAAAAGLARPDSKLHVVTPVHGGNVLFRYVLVSAEMKPFSITPESNQPAFAKQTDLTQRLRQHAHKLGVDLFGVSSVKRIESLLPVIQKEYADEPYVDVMDMEDGLLRAGYGKTIPFPASRKHPILGPGDHLDKAKSVLVLGLHYPDVCIERALEPPAQTPGPYATYAQCLVYYELSMMAKDVIDQLEAAGYQAKATWDLMGLASRIRHPWGIPGCSDDGFPSVPDATANRYTALCAGLGHIGRSGIVLSETFGGNQRFVAIITDAPLDEDDLADHPHPCRDCHECETHCQTGALNGNTFTIHIQGRDIEIPHIDRCKCDWEKRFGLIGNVGPAQMSSPTDVPLPETIDEQTVCEALRTYDPVQKRLICVVEPCIKHCPACNTSHRHPITNKTRDN